MTGEVEGDAEPAVEELVREQLAVLRAEVRSVTGSLVATSDGLLVAADLPDRPDQVAALTASLVGMARYAVDVTGTGAFTETVARGTDGYLAAFALDGAATLTVVAEADLNVALLQHKLQPIRERLGELAARFTGFADFDVPVPPHGDDPLGPVTDPG